MLASTLRTLSVQTRNWLSASHNIAKWFQTDVMDLFAKKIISLKEREWVNKRGRERERKRDRGRDWVEIWCFTFNFSASPCIACLAILELDWIFSFASSHSRFQQIFFIFRFIPFSLFDLKITQFSSKLFDFPHLLPNELFDRQRWLADSMRNFDCSFATVWRISKEKIPSKRISKANRTQRKMIELRHSIDREIQGSSIQQHNRKRLARPKFSQSLYFRQRPREQSSTFRHSNPDDSCDRIELTVIINFD